MNNVETITPQYPDFGALLESVRENGRRIDERDERFRKEQAEREAKWQAEMKAANDAEGGGGLYTLVMVLVGLVCLYLVVPLLSATIRRLHDTGKSGWWVLVSLVPSIGELILFIMCLSPSEPYDNRYGRFKPYHY